MSLPIVIAPNKIFKQKAEIVTEVNNEIKQIVDQMFDTLKNEHAIGLGANMVGILKRIIVISMSRCKEDDLICMINPEIIYQSKNLVPTIEASLSFPGIEAEISRPDAVKVKYLDYDGKEQEMEADGFLATVIQHEVDYLNGIVYLDYLSKMKRDLLMDKMKKFVKNYKPHIHGEHCHH